MRWGQFLPGASRSAVVRRLMAALVCASVAALILAPARAPGARASTPGTLISESFATGAAAADFTVVAGGAWTSGNYVLTLSSPASQTPSIGNANIVVHNTALSGNWSLAARMSAASSATQAGFSVVLGFHDATHYCYANFSQRQAAGAAGIYDVSGSSAVQLASFSSAATIVPGRNYDVAVARTGSTVTVQVSGVAVGSATVPLDDPMHIGFGSQGSVVTARHLTVTGTATVLPSPTATSTAQSSPSAGASPTPAPTPTTAPSPTAAPTSLPTAAPTPPPNPAPTQIPSSSACAPGAFPSAFFAPSFTGAPTRTFSSQFISEQPDASYITTCYPAGSTSPSSGSPGGAQAQLAIAAGPGTKYTLTYQLRFPVGYQWVKGGKLPGLCGGQCWTGSNNGPGGWATRYMWRSGGQGEVLLSDATTTGYGTDLGLGSWSFSADGQWHTLSQTVTMNTPGQADGSIVVHYDGGQVADFTGITFRAAGDTDSIDSLMFSTFYGGHDSSWAPSAMMYIDFRGFTAG